MLCNIYENFGFSAQWVTLSGAEKIKNCALECYRSFSYVSPGSGPALLRIAAESYYVLYLNGQFVGRGPARGTFGVNYFDTYDVTNILREREENHIAVLIQSMNAIGNYNSYPAGCALLAEIPGVLVTDASWKVRLMPGWVNSEEYFTIQHGYKVEMDLRSVPQENWRLGEGTENWANAVAFSSEGLSRKALRPRGIPGLASTQALPQLLKAAKIALPPASASADNFRKRSDIGAMEPQEVREAGDMAWTVELPTDQDSITAVIYDFGTPRIGYFDFFVSGEELDGVRLDVIYGEELWNGRLRTVYPLDIYSFTDTYYLRNGENHICHPFEMHGGSMMHLYLCRTDVAASPQSVRISGVRCLECRYPYEAASSFRSSEPLLDRIWELCKETMAACTTDLFIDCPWREHAFWVNDLLVENRSSLKLFGASDIHRHAFDVLFSQQFPNGWIPGVAPDACTQDKPLNLLAPTMLFLFTNLEDYFLASGDSATVKRYLPNLRAVLDAFEKTTDATGIILSPDYDSNFYDWGFEQNNITLSNARESMLNSLYILAIKQYLWLCEQTGTVEAEAAKLEARIARVSQAVRSFLVTDEATGRKVLEDNAFTMIDGVEERKPITIRSELAQALGILSGAFTAEENADFLQNILDGKLHRPELYLQCFVLQALAENGHAEEALARIRRYWSIPVQRGATTIPESAIYGYGREMFWESGSLCHGFSTCPVDFLQSFILGIRPLKPGYAEFALNPRTCGLKNASGQVYTPHGTISVQWKCAGQGQIAGQIYIPVGCTAVLPDGRRLAAGCQNFTI